MGVRKMDQTDPVIAVVYWADAHCGEGGWQTLEDYEDDGEAIVTTVGFLVPHDSPGGKKDHITVWQTITDGEGIHPFHIPGAMVRGVKLVTLPEETSNIS
jgi:hypothetical protein